MKNKAQKNNNPEKKRKISEQTYISDCSSSFSYWSSGNIKS